MDRLLVGDVGFGKTEVAFRAMFKTVLDSKQAVLLAPTTILARQHYENLVGRLKPFGIKCGLLTRLQSSKETEQLLEGLKNGTVHMVVATHKVLAKAVEFHDLGLLVLDEEQRFGVEHQRKAQRKISARQRAYALGNANPAHAQHVAHGRERYFYARNSAPRQIADSDLRRGIFGRVLR